MGRRLRAFFPAAAGGLVAGHFLTYVVLSPAGPHRAAFLRQTGHGYFARAITFAAALSAIAMGAAAARGAARRRSAYERPIDVRALTLWFAVVQAIGFVFLEAVERFAVGAPLGGLVGVLPAGLAIEAVVAALVVWVLVLIERASGAIVRTIERRSKPRRAPESTAFPVRTGEISPVLRQLASSLTLRGPPPTCAS